MRPLLLACTIILAWLPTAHSEYSDQVRQWPRVQLRLSQEITLTDVFASGLRPYRRPFAENKQVFAKHAVIQVINRNGTAFPPLPAEIMRVKVQKPQLIQTLELWSPPLTINETRLEARKWLPLFDKTETELDEFLSAVSKDWMHYDVVNGSSDVIRFVAGVRDADGLQITVALKKSWQWQAPLRISFFLEALMPSRNRIAYYEGPISPPPGYENADMTAPKDWEGDKLFVPLTTEPRSAQGTLPPQYEAMNEKARAEAAAKKSLPATQPPAPEKAPEPKAVAQEAPSSWPPLWTIILALLMAALWLLVWRMRKRN